MHELGARLPASRDKCPWQPSIQARMPRAGVVLDPVYSGKAWAALSAEMAAEPGAWRGRRVLFLHTGGLLGMYDKADQLQPLVQKLGKCKRLDVGSS